MSYVSYVSYSCHMISRGSLQSCVKKSFCHVISTDGQDIFEIPIAPCPPGRSGRNIRLESPPLRMELGNSQWASVSCPGKPFCCLICCKVDHLTLQIVHISKISFKILAPWFSTPQTAVQSDSPSFASDVRLASQLLL